MTGLLVKMAEIDIVDPEEVKGVLKASVEYQIELLWDLAPPLSPILPRRDSGKKPPSFWWFFRS